MESIYFENVSVKGMSIAALGKGKKTDGYLVVYRLGLGNKYCLEEP